MREEGGARVAFIYNERLVGETRNVAVYMFFLLL